MAETKKPRIRKTAPTARERIEESKAKADAPVKKGYIKPKISAVARPLRKLHLPSLPDNKATRPLKRIGRLFVPRYFINAWREVRQVVWPSRRETWRLTLAVFIFASVFGALVAGVDKVLDILFKNLVLK
jgi:preprotein translocase SecE subunit